MVMTGFYRVDTGSRKKVSIHGAKFSQLISINPRIVEKGKLYSFRIAMYCVEI